MTHPTIVILTGSGISAESGIDTFRGAGGLWNRNVVQDLANPQAFARDPKKVHEFYNMRRRGLIGKEPNAAHHALARLEAEYPGDVLVVTQNVDHLHETAGTKNLFHMHGELRKAWCQACDLRMPWQEDLTIEIPCPSCGDFGQMRPDIVWFGEMPYHMDAILAALDAAEVFTSIGTSGTVYPAAGFVEIARNRGVHTVELNLEPSDNHWDFSESHHGPATEVVPQWVDQILRT
ncbi:NAD-dependent deacylase [Halocynthiibacter styelae]|uniref:NAD-dependent protein deacylase n=1 Tax=Halocynthiibacter styelae TaxID=2761955 RepID=A0A8J7IBL8_9RHOB|nr:NAD-dependent deacylase [Paenihalocynthiibacter styelae]MBI1492373.1 NAD-dependent deacylase [Paenihalocynthiibacter styelae]